jgi:NAD(P)-dependent dehydrogenase (short-subunit alcohol dehydrogenase family)
MEEVAMQLFKVNAIGNIHLYNLFLPLLLKGKVKKAINVASGTADLDWTNNLDIEVSSLYAMSKAAMNMVTAKFSAQYKKDGVLFVGICPGMVDCGHYQKGTPPTPISEYVIMAGISNICV